MSHNCPDCGIEHGFDVDEPVAVIDEAPAAEAAVQIAEIEANRDVSVARIHAKTEEAWQESRVAELEGRLAGMAEILEQLKPPAPEPVPVVVEEPAPEPIAPQPTIESPPIADPVPPQSSKKKNAFW